MSARKRPGDPSDATVTATEEMSDNVRGQNNPFNDHGPVIIGSNIGAQETESRPAACVSLLKIVPAEEAEHFASPARKRIRGGSCSLAAPTARGCVEVISLLDVDDDDDDGGGKVGPCDASLFPPRVAVGGKNDSSVHSRNEPTMGGGVSSAPSGPLSYDVVIIGSYPPPIVKRSSYAAVATTTAAARPAASPIVATSADVGKGDKDDCDEANEEAEVETVRVDNALRLPHARHDCPDFKFVPDLVCKRSPSTPPASAKAEIEEGLRTNPKRCDLCYCYVCDVLATKCDRWAGEGLQSPNDHCLACDIGVDADRWKKLRKEAKGAVATAGGGSGGNEDNEEESSEDGTETNGDISSTISQDMPARQRRRPGVSSTTPSFPSQQSVGSLGAASRSRLVARMALQDRLEALYRGSGGGGGVHGGAGEMRSHAAPSSDAGVGAMESGPWLPEDVVAWADLHLTQCRYCKYYTRFPHNNFTRTREVYSEKLRDTVTEPHLNEVGCEDWCHACGRIASERDFEKVQSSVYSSTPEDVHLGTKEIRFRLRPHDPRKMKAFESRWLAHSTRGPRGGSGMWVYDEGEMMADLFRHRFGPRPTMGMINSSIPIVAESNLPMDGAVLKLPTGAPSQPKELSATECEALILNEQSDRVLMEELHKFNFAAEKKAHCIAASRDDAFQPLDGDITAEWDKKRKMGTFTIRLFLRRTAFVETSSDRSCKVAPKDGGRISHVLGAWFGVFPFPLVNLTNGIRAKMGDNESRKRIVNTRLPCPPWLVDKDGIEQYLPSHAEESASITAYNTEAKQIKEKNSFLSSNVRSSGGGVCSNDSSFAGTLRRYFSEKLVEDSQVLFGYSHVASLMGHAGRKLGIVSHHRSMRSSNSSSVYESYSTIGSNGFNKYVRDEDHVLLAENVLLGIRSVYEHSKTLNGLLDQLENLGHAPAPPTDGLNVELLEFQRQAVGWALERENAPGGIQSFFWAKVPRGNGGSLRSGTASDLYFNPVLDMFSTSPPRIARGGFIAHQMGLGKTIISLALVLQNPAPELPLSGSVVCYDEDVSTCGGGSSPGRPGWSHRKELAKQLDEDESGKRASVFSRGTLVICNVSLVGQWIDEAKSKLKNPGLVYSYYGSGRKRDSRVLAQKSIVVTTYATLASDATRWAKKEGEGYCPPCEQVRWWRIICDESHTIKDLTQQTRAVLRLIGENKWCVTGTPMNTCVNDLVNQMKMIGVDHTTRLFHIFNATMENHCKSNSSSERRRRRIWNKRHECGNLLFVFRSILIRHAMRQKCRETKIDLMSLPPKEERTMTIPFTGEDRNGYNKLEATAVQFYNRIKSLARNELSKNYLKIFSALMPLRQACSGIVLTDDEDSGKDKNAHRMSPGDDLECSICLELFDDPCATKCAHVFCRDCIEGILLIGDESGPCPLCRKECNISHLRKAILPNVNNKTLNQKKALTGVVFKSKFTVLLQELERIRRTEPGSKSLVFSQFTSTIEWMKEQLPKHGFQFRTLSGSMNMDKRTKALRDFQNDPPTTIFLLSTRAGAVGINLTQANRVFLMEPAFNPALEAQAIGRVYRLGQQKKVEIIRLLMADSFETRLVRLLEKKYGRNDNCTDDEKSTSSENEDSVGDSTDEVEAPGTVSDSAVGCIFRDKATVTADDFDLLFGCI